MKHAVLLVVAILVGALVSSGVLADATLTSEGEGLVLKAGQVLPSVGSRMEDASGSVVLTRASLGEVAPGRSENANGVVLMAGTLKVPEPQTPLLGLGAVATLLFIARTRRSAFGSWREL